MAVKEYIDLEISEIKSKFELLKKATLQNTIIVKDLAKELKVSITDLMQYIEEHPQLFATEEVWSYKAKQNYYYVCGKKCTETVSVKDKLKGLGISSVYLKPEDNYRTDEWLKKQERIFDKTIWISKWDNYGSIEGEYVNGDYNDKFRSHLWRNTPVKIKELKEIGALYDTTFFVGGYGDCTQHECKTAINAEGKKIAEENGWTIVYA